MTTSTIKVLQDYIFTSKYARWIESEQRRETWGEAVDRVKAMMLTQYEDKGVDDDIEWAYDMMRKKRVLGSQRALQFGGKPAFKKNARIFNCVASNCDRPRFFQEYFWLLLCGCGAGFSVQKHHIAKLPPLQKGIAHKDREIVVYTIPDTIEGWANSVTFLLTTYLDTDKNFTGFFCTDKPEYVNYQVEFDYSEIRPKGAPLSSGIGKAPGPEGLRQALEKIRELLDCCWLDCKEKLSPVNAFDICMHIADAVLSGGVRRSATIALFSVDDMEMVTAKTGNWWKENPQRQRANISALLVRNQTTIEQFQSLMDSVKEFGEPGFYWSDSPEMVPNPCCEISFFTYDIINEKKFLKWKKDHLCDPITGDPEKIGLKSGWQGCNLSTTNCANLKGETKEEKTAWFMDNVKAATILGTLQAGFTNLDYLGETSENIFKREALLGVSMTGMMDNYDVVLDPEIQRKAASIVKRVNAALAAKIGINPFARGTCLKPEGTGSLILGTLATGIHSHHYVRYLRTVQANTDEAVYQYFKQFNADACEPSITSANKTDDVVYFPIEVPDGAKTKNQLPALEMLKIVKSTQQNWVMQGKRKERCVMPWIQNNVSNTVTVRDDEWDDVTDYIFKNRKYFTGVTLLGTSGDKDYPQAPYCAVYTSRQIAKEYGEAALWTSGLIELGLTAFNKELYSACLAVLTDDYNPLNDKDLNDGWSNDLWTAAKRKEFVERCHKFANRYFDGDFKKLTYCMKDVFNWKRWHDLNLSFTPVDYTQLKEIEDNTAPEQEVSCSGGACSII